MLSRKHYKAIAEILCAWGEVNREDLIDSLVAYFKEDNPRFDERKFRDACGS